MLSMNEKPNIFRRGLLILGIPFLILLAAFLFWLMRNPEPVFSVEWETYTNPEYHFSMQYPPHWHYLEVANNELSGVKEQVLFLSEGTPPSQTDARSDITLVITETDPSERWQPKFFENYNREVIQISDLTAERISGINKEGRFEEQVVIIKIGDHYIQAIPNFSAESLAYFDQAISSLRFDPLEVPTQLPIAASVSGSGAAGTSAFEGVSFSYPYALAEEVIAQKVPAFIDPSGFMYYDYPAHVRFDFANSYATQEPFEGLQPGWTPWMAHQNPDNPELLPQIFIFPTRAYGDISSLAAERIEALKSLLKDRTLSAGVELPVLPTFNCTQDLHSRVRQLAFQGGRGLRYIARCSQEAAPVNNPSVFYTFQGLTEDRSLYVAAFFPLYIDILPDQYQVEDWEAFNQGYQDYLVAITSRLDKLDPGDFAPNLESLDELIRSLRISDYEVAK